MKCIPLLDIINLILNELQKIPTSWLYTMLFAASDGLIIIIIIMGLCENSANRISWACKIFNR
jgi:hypothetical protein